MSHHQVVRTRSGALAMRNAAAGEVMHPGVGPLVEADLLYVRQSRLGERLRAAAGSELVLFDVGMGAGSNAAAAFGESERAPASAARLVLISFECDLEAMETALAHPAAFGLDGRGGVAARALLTAHHHQTPRTDWHLERGDVLQRLDHQTRPADLVFWDPFSPRINPALWTVAAFTALRRVAGPRCTLFTYSASTAVRTALLLAGWMVGVGDAIGSKAATTAAAIRREDLARPLERRWLRRLSLPDARFAADAPADALQRLAAAPQFAVNPAGPGETFPVPDSR